MSVYVAVVTLVVVTAVSEKSVAMIVRRFAPSIYTFSTRSLPAVVPSVISKTEVFDPVYIAAIHTSTSPVDMAVAVFIADTGFDPYDVIVSKVAVVAPE